MIPYNSLSSLFLTFVSICQWLYLARHQFYHLTIEMDTHPEVKIFIINSYYLLFKFVIVYHTSPYICFQNFGYFILNFNNSHFILISLPDNKWTAPAASTWYESLLRLPSPTQQRGLHTLRAFVRLWTMFLYPWNDWNWTRRALHLPNLQTSSHSEAVCNCTGIIVYFLHFLSVLLFNNLFHSWISGVRPS